MDPAHCPGLGNKKTKTFFLQFSDFYVFIIYKIWWHDKIEGGGPVMYEFELGRAGHYFYIFGNFKLLQDAEGWPHPGLDTYKSQHIA